MERLPAVAQQFCVREGGSGFYLDPADAVALFCRGGDRWALLPSAAGFVDPCCPRLSPDPAGDRTARRTSEQGNGARTLRV